MRENDETHMSEIARGAAVLGTGGGSDPYVVRLLAQQALLKHGPVTLREAREKQKHPIAAATALLSAQRLFSGKILDIERTTIAGFSRSEARLDGVGKNRDSSFELTFQDEHLVARRDGDVVASVPDLICVLDTDYRAGNNRDAPLRPPGDRLGCTMGPRWRTDAALEVVGPRYFGYADQYVPIWFNRCTTMVSMRTYLVSALS